MKEKFKLPNLNLKKFFKYFLIILLILGIFTTLLLIFIYRDYIYTQYLSLSLKEPARVESINNKIISEESVVIDVVEQAGDSIVSIVVSDDIFSDFSTPVGSGVIVDSDGLIVTNKHVIDDEFAEYEVVLQSGERYKVTETIKDKSKDLALLKVSANNLNFLDTSRLVNLKLGQKAIAIGNSIGLSNTVSVGIVSGLNREVEIEGELVKNLIQTDAAINPGNSGGALLSSSGDLLGINTARSSYAENIGFAIPAKVVNELITKYKKGEITKDSVPAFLGIGFTFRNLKDYVNRGLPIGPVITGVLKNSPADKAGLKTGDIIVSISDIEFGDEYELSEFIKEQNAGDRVNIKVYRKGEILELEAILAQSQN